MTADAARSGSAQGRLAEHGRGKYPHRKIRLKRRFSFRCCPIDAEVIIP